ncbi:MAG: hypothetical protein Q7R81_07110 [Candidatus Peregrinibacteria bacterium]|nr:hypothetical protein [Candidatus Peregrinibacteria bacterium]
MEDRTPSQSRDSTQNFPLNRRTQKSSTKEDGQSGLDQSDSLLSNSGSHFQEFDYFVVIERFTGKAKLTYTLIGFTVIVLLPLKIMLEVRIPDSDQRSAFELLTLATTMTGFKAESEDKRSRTFKLNTGHKKLEDRQIEEVRAKLAGIGLELVVPAQDKAEGETITVSDDAKAALELAFDESLERLGESDERDLLAILQAEGARMKVSPEAKAALKLAMKESFERIVQEHRELFDLHTLLRAEGARMKISPEAKAALKLAMHESLERIAQGGKTDSEEPCVSPFAAARA